MTYWLEILTAFMLGILFNKLWDWLLYTGYSILLLKQTQDDSVRLMAMSAQTIAEIQAIKYLELERSGKTEKYIEIQREVDDRYTKPLKEAMIKNYISVFPRRYSHLLQFYDWNSAMDYVDQLIKKERK